MTSTVVGSRLGSRVNSRWAANPDANYPVTASHVNLLTGITPTALWPCTQLSGNLVDVVGGFNLAPVAAPVYQAQVGDRRGIRYAQGANDAHLADVCDLAAASGMYVCMVLPSQSQANFDGIMGRLNAAGADGVAGYMVGGQNYPQFVFRDSGANQLTLTPVTIDIRSQRQVCLFVIQIDRTAAVARVRISQPGRLVTEVSGSIAGFATFTGAAQSFGFGALLPATSLVGGASVCWGMFATGAQCEGATRPQIVARGLGFES